MDSQIRSGLGDDDAAAPYSQTYEFFVYDMRCRKNCASKICEKLNSIAGIEFVHLDFAGKRFTVTYDSRIIGDIKKVIDESVTALGYTVTVGNIEDVELKLNFPEEKQEVDVLLDHNAPPLVTHKCHTNNGIKTVKIGIIGMECGSCASKIEENLRAIPYVNNANVSLLSGIAVVEYVGDNIVLNNLLQQINTIGYKANIISQSDSNNRKIQFKIDHPPLSDSKDNVYDFCNKLTLRFPDIEDVNFNQYERTFVVTYDKNKVPIRDVYWMFCRKFGSDSIHVTRLSTYSSIVENYKQTITMWRNMFVQSCLYGIPSMIIMIIQMSYHQVEEYTIVPGLSVFNFVMFLLCLFSQIGVGRYFYFLSYKAARRKSLNMFTLISIASIIAFVYSIVVIAIKMAQQDNSKRHLFFETPQMLVLFVSLGKFLETIAEKRTTDAIQKLIDMEPKSAILILPTACIPFDCSDKTQLSQLDTVEECIQYFETPHIEYKQHDIDCAVIHEHDVLKVKPGEKIPADGIIVFGCSEIDESLLTGESTAIPKALREKVYAGSINCQSSILIFVTNSGDDLAIEQLAAFINQATLKKAPIEELANKLSSYFVPLILGISSITFILWMIVLRFAHINDSLNEQPISYSFQAAVSVLCVACPCALGLATPTAVMVSTGVGALNGLLIKGGNAIENLCKVTTIVFDKTGTLTNGNPTCKGYYLNRYIMDINERILMKIILSMESQSIHPIAIAISSYIREKFVDIATIQNLQVNQIHGQGCETAILKSFFDTSDSTLSQSQFVYIGNRRLLMDKNIQIHPDITKNALLLEQHGHTIVFVSVDNSCLGYFDVYDEIRPYANVTIDTLRDHFHMKVVMITGDSETTAKTVAAQLGITEFYSTALPTMKVNHINELKKNGQVVAMVGDGINDSMALSEAHVGISLCGASQIAIESADIILSHNNLLDILNAIQLSKLTLGRIKTNLFFSLIYNLLAVPISAGSLVHFKIYIEPWMASVAMASSSISVVLSSLWLRRYKKRYTPQTV